LHVKNYVVSRLVSDHLQDLLLSCITGCEISIKNPIMPVSPPKVYSSIYPYIDAANFKNFHNGKVVLVTGEKLSEMPDSMRRDQD
jgi:hypothetical protein